MEYVSYLIDSLNDENQGNIIKTTLCSADDAEKAVKKVKDAKISGHPLSEEQLKELALYLISQGQKLNASKQNEEGYFDELFEGLSSRKK